MRNEKKYDNILRTLGKIFLVIGAMWLTKAMFILSIGIPSLMLIVLISLVLLGMFVLLVWQGIDFVKLIMEL